MQEKLKELENLVDKYISALKELKIENTQLKEKIKQLEFEKQELIKRHNKNIDVKHIKNSILKRVERINSKIEKLEKKLLE